LQQKEAKQWFVNICSCIHLFFYIKILNNDIKVGNPWIFCGQIDCKIKQALCIEKTRNNARQTSFGEEETTYVCEGQGRPAIPWTHDRVKGFPTPICDQFLTPPIVDGTYGIIYRGAPYQRRNQKNSRQLRQNNKQIIVD